jgi:hypothetical protein
MFDLIRSSCSRWQTVLRTSLLACSEPSTRGVFPDFCFKSAEVLIMTIVDHREQLERLKREGLSMLLAAQGLPCSPALPVCLLARGAVRHTGTAARLRDQSELRDRCSRAEARHRPSSNSAVVQVFFGKLSTVSALGHIVHGAVHWALGFVP